MTEFANTLAQAYALYSEESGVDISKDGGHEHDTILHKAWDLFMHSNGLNPMMYPSLRKFECEIVSMATWLFNGDIKCAGSLRSSCTESILMAIKTYRDMARKKKLLHKRV